MKTYFDLIPLELKALIQLYLSNKNDIINYCEIIGEYKNKNYWELFYSLFNNNWKKIISETYITQYLYLLNFGLPYEFHPDPLRTQLNSQNIIEEVEKGRLDVFEYLLGNNFNSKFIIDINQEDKNGNTALMWASAYGYLNITELLIDNNANINHQNTYGNTALTLASEKGYLNIIKILVEKGADINIQNKGRNTALMIATMHGHLDIVKFLSEIQAC